MSFPPPNATRAEVNAWYAQQPKAIPHEAPEVQNGPSLMCNACGIVRVRMFTPFCKGCMTELAAAGVGPTP